MNSAQRNQEHYIPLLSGNGDDIPDASFQKNASDDTTAYTATSPISYYLTVALSCVSVLLAIFFYYDAGSPSAFDISDPRFVASLRKVTPYPNIENLRDVAKLKSAPKLLFPGYIARANAAEPDTLYASSSSVTLSPSDSMFFRWHTTNPENSRCYVTAAVPSPEHLLNSTKSYVAEGDVSAIEIWNVSYSAIPTEMSWNTRPPRQALLGTVNFTAPIDYYDPDRDGIELRPPTPLFECGGEQRMAIEVACSDCKLNFEQIFSMPALAFDVWLLQ
ncbi:hypothetical protein BJ138DRAFT_1142429 [Hygrophoropsis aurantiaca]|uniref:Uncharacterized protein n=1 Tax=Hygrophoropsis aurantiaca TaxID=72124 RepID=A0ACB8AP35_9AGAM|nr:hypothetical protein BJ138DRAFT_1142429 [Hygrophoropsis aurantiaca]